MAPILLLATSPSPVHSSYTLYIYEHELKDMLRAKATWPDGASARILECADQLTIVGQHLVCLCVS